MTTLIGRQRELDALDDALSAHESVLLFGPPGVGKSELVAHWLRRKKNIYEVCHVDLEHVAEMHVALRTIATTLGLPVEFKDNDLQRPLRHITHYLQNQLNAGNHIVLWCDHVERAPIEVHALIRKLQSQVNGLRCLWSSRTSLGEFEGEVIALDPLSMQPIGDAPSEAAQLFLQLAPNEDLCAVEALVTQLDGLPLAIVLAAARSAWLTPAALATSFAHDTIAPLHRAIELSWAPLEQTTRQCLQACAVVNDGLTAAHLATITGLDAQDVSDHLETLRQHSLLVRHKRRWRMLNSVRHFVQTQGEHNTAIRDGLAQCFAEQGQRAFFEQAGDAFFGEQDHDDLLHYDFAIRHALSTQAWNMVVDALLGLVMALHQRGDMYTIGQWCEQLALHLPQMTWHQRAKLALASTILTVANMNQNESYVAIREAWQDAIEPGPLKWAMLVHLTVSSQYAYEDEDIERFYLDLAQALKHDSPSAQWAARMWFAVSHHHLHQFDFDRALSGFERTIALTDDLNWPNLKGQVLAYKAFVLQQLGRALEADEALQGAAHLYEGSGRIDALAHTLRLGIDFDLDNSRPQQALAKLDRLQNNLDHFGIPWFKGYPTMQRGQIALDLHQWAQAQEHFKRALFYFEQENDGDYLIAIEFFLAMVDVGQAEPQRAYDRLCELEEVARERSKWSLAMIHGALIGLAHHLGKTPQQTWVDAMANIAQQHPLMHAIDRVYTCCSLWPVYLEQLNTNQLARAKTTYVSILTHLNALLVPTEQPSVASKYSEVRYVMMIFWSMVDEPYHAQLHLDARDPQLDGMTVLRHRRQYRPPGWPRWFNFQRRAIPMQLLWHLLDAHQNEPETSTSTATLCARLWPEEDAEPEALHNRLYVTINELKRDGLEHVIENVQHPSHGYRLLPTLTIYE